MWIFILHVYDAYIFVCLSDLVVASPVEDYFLFIDGLPSSEKVRLNLMSSSRLKVQIAFIR